MADYLNVDKRECASRKACVKKVIKALKVKEKELKKKLEEEKDDKQRQILCEEIEVVHKQRKKGLKALKELKNPK